MSEIPNDPAPETLAQAIEANICGYFRCLGAVSGADLRDDASVLVVATGTPKSDYNVVLRCRFAQADADHEIDEIERIMAVFRTRRLNMAWYTSAFTRPVDLGARLERQGLVRGPDIPGMAVDLGHISVADALPPGCSITSVRSLDDMRQWMSEGVG